MIIKTQLAVFCTRLNDALEFDSSPRHSGSLVIIWTMGYSSRPHISVLNACRVFLFCFVFCGDQKLFSSGRRFLCDRYGCGPGNPL